MALQRRAPECQLSASKKEKLPTSLENKWLKKENKKLLLLKKLPRKRLRLLRNKQPLPD